MKRTLCITLAVIVMVTLFHATSWAVLEERDDLVFGVGSITYDTDTGFEWLDLTLSTGMSYNQVSAQLGPGGTFEGFRYATGEEVENLFIAAGITEFDVPLSEPESIAAFEFLINLIGITNTYVYESGTWHYSVGITGSDCPFSPSPSSVQVVYIYGSSNSTLGPRVTAMVNSLCYGLDTNFTSVGNWLVRVIDPQSLIQEIVNIIMELNINHGISNSLDAKLSSALSALDDLNENNDVAAINSLQAFINAVEAQSGKQISEELANELISLSQDIIDLLSQ